jgi:hypothetical protein
MGVLYTHSPKRPSPFSKLLKKKEKNQLKKTKRPQANRAAAGGHLLVATCCGPPLPVQRLLVVEIPNDQWSPIGRP